MKILTNYKHRNTSLLAVALMLLGSLTAPLASANNQTQLLDQVVAIVDNGVITASELKERIQQVKANIEKSGRSAPPMQELHQDILNQLIVENIQLQMALRAGVRISDAQLNDSMRRIAKQNGMNLQQFKQTLEADGLSYATAREQIRREILLQRVQQGNVNQRIQVTDQEIANFLTSKEGQSITAPEYRMLHTLITVTGDADKTTLATAKKMANAIYQRIAKGETYEAVISSYNQLQTNDLGWRKAAELPSLMADLATTTDEGATAAPVQSPSGFHLVKLLGKRGDGETIAQTKARHILLKPSAIRNEAATKNEIKALRQRIIDGENFADLAREFSEDIGSALEGGDLGWTNRGQLVGAFQDAMDSTEPGDISPAFKSQYGWHIVQVIQRRDKDVTDDIRRNIARNHIHQRKYDDELQTWLQKIRDEAYVDFK